MSGRRIPDILEWFDPYQDLLELVRISREPWLDEDDARRREWEQFRRLMWRRDGLSRLARGYLRQARQFVPPPETIYIRSGREIVGVEGPRLLADAKFVVSDKYADVLLRIDGREYPVVDIRAKLPPLVRPPTAPEPAAQIEESDPSAAEPAGPLPDRTAGWKRIKNPYFAWLRQQSSWPPYADSLATIKELAVADRARRGVERPTAPARSTLKVWARTLRQSYVAEHPEANPG
jgi:hypothetical protein